tara:strand:+ start:12796 stop:13233 length:438 start_codon:yes stop_codon:yes gene_type:complete
MATTGVFNGTKMLSQLSTDGGSSYTTIGHSTSASFSFSMDTPEASSKDSGGYQEVIAGARSAEVSFDGLVAYDDSWNIDNFIDYMIGPSNGRSSLHVSWGTATSGDKYYTAKCYVSSIEYSGEAENPVTYSGTLVITGSITTSTR